MSVKLVFEFAPNVTHAEVIEAVNVYFGSAKPIPAYIKQAVETVGAELIAAQDNPSNGVETNPAVAFGGLMNGGNVNAASSADAATSTTAPVANPGTSQTSVPASSVPAPPPANVAVAPTGNAGSTNHANVDNTGLPWDARIHSETPTLTDKGVWRKKRGVDKTLVATVEKELRAGNVGAASNAGQSAGHISKTQSPALPGNLVFADGNAKKTAAIEHADAQAKIIAGPQLIDDSTLNGLLNGKQTMLSPQQLEWYEVYFAARNAKFSEFMNAATVQTAAAPELDAIAQVNAPQVDATGLKWDARIHVNPPAFDSAGVYVQRMDVAPQFKLDVMAELRTGNAQPTGAVTPNIPPVPGSVGGTTEPEVTGSMTFVEIMKWIASNQIAKRITADQVSEVVGTFGLPNVAALKNTTDFNDAIVEMLKMYGAE